MARIVGAMSLVCLFLVGMTTTANADDHLDFFAADLSSANEVDDPGDPEGTGSASLVIDSDASVVCFIITFDGIEDPVAAHIHAGAAGVNGDVVVDFDWVNNPGEGCVAGDPATIQAILDAPSVCYINVHTSEFPAGAIRGQLMEGDPDVELLALVEGDPAIELLAQTGSKLTLFLLFAGAAFIVGGAMIYAIWPATRD